MMSKNILFYTIFMFKVIVALLLLYWMVLVECSVVCEHF